MAAALGASRGAAITGNQHGGAYGQYASCPTERAERKFCDRFATWGWIDNEPLPAKLYPVPQMHLTYLVDSWEPGGKKGLWASNSVPMQTYRIQLYPQDADLYDHYFDERESFLQELSDEVAEALLYRPYVWDYGWFKKEQMMLAQRPEIVIDCHGTLIDALQSAKFFVCDHLGTGMLLALLIGTPTVLFWDNTQTPLRKFAIPYFDALLNAKILFHSPVQAAKHVNKFWKHTEDWWHQKDVEYARKKFTETFCSTSKNWLSYWKKFFDIAS